MGKIIKIIDAEEGTDEFDKATQRIHELIGRNNINRIVQKPPKQEVPDGDRSKNVQSDSRGGGYHGNRTYTSGDKRYIKRYNKKQDYEQPQAEYDQYDILSRFAHGE